MPSELELPADYKVVLQSLKQQVRSAQQVAQRTVNTELIRLYWTVGRTILEQQGRAGWGSGVVGRLATDLRAEFPDMKGFSRRNLLYMRAFAEAWPELGERVPQAVALLPWGHIRLLLDKVETQGERDWYAAAANEHGWSRSVLQHQIVNGLIDREGSAPSNFDTHLENADSDLARQLAKDPYVFDFLGLSAEVDERRLEQALMDRLVDDHIRREQHSPTVGILLVADKSEAVVRYALSGASKPIAVSSYTYESLPASEKAALPPADQLAQALERRDDRKRE